MRHRTGILTMIGLSSFLLCGASSPTTCKSSGSLGPTTGEVVGVAVAAGAVIVGTVVLIEVNHSHHTIKGCVSAGPNGVQVENESDKRTYGLLVSPANVKVGDIVRLHGKKEKNDKDGSGNREFVVEKIGRDYGPCLVNPAPSASGAH